LYDSPFGGEVTGHVFHPGHQELHGITVVLETRNAELYVGRYDRQDDLGVHLIGVSVYDPAQAQMSAPEFLARTAKFGVRVDRPHLVVPLERVQGITALGSIGLS
jgi:hypothetical protein